jgi:hypothetical protein
MPQESIRALTGSSRLLIAVKEDVRAYCRDNRFSSKTDKEIFRSMLDLSTVSQLDGEPQPVSRVLFGLILVIFGPNDGYLRRFAVQCVAIIISTANHLGKSDLYFTMLGAAIR